MQIEPHCAINEDEKESNPVYKIIYNKIRNLKKVLAQIAHIQTVEPKSRKAAQISKLNRKGEILAEIDKHEEFAVYYKKMVVEHDLVYDKVDDLIKLSTMLTVCKRVDAEGYCPAETKDVFENVYKGIFHQTCFNGKNQLSDEIVRVYHVLNNFFDSPEYLSQCRDYMTYLPEIEALKQKLEGRELKAGSEVQKIVVVQKSKKRYKGETFKQQQGDTWCKSNKFTVFSEVFAITIDNTIVDELPSFSDLKIDEISTASGIQSSEDELKLEKHETGSTACPDTEKDSMQLEIELAESNHQDNVWAKKQEVVYDSHANINSIHSPQNSLPQNSNSSNFRENNRARNRRNKKQQQHCMEVDHNVRKCSDTSLEPTPQKHKGKRVRYIEKKIEQND